MLLPGSIYIDNPAYPVVQGLFSYVGVTTANGAASGKTLVCAGLAFEPNYAGQTVKVLTGGAWGQPRAILSHIGATLNVDQAFTDATGAPVQIIAGTIFMILSVLPPLTSVYAALARPSGPSLFESWQDEAGIDLTTWAITNPVTGAAWARGAVGENLMAYSSPNLNEFARLRSLNRWVVAPTLYGTNKIYRRFSLEFEMHIVNLLANLDPAAFFLGLTPAIGDTRITQDIIGWALVLVGGINRLQTVTDAATFETVNTGFGENLVLTNKFKIEVSFNSVEFFLNEVSIATHAVNLPSLPMYLNFYIPTAATGATTLRFGVVRAWTEDLVR